jgi:hypothetical protein
VTALIYCSCHHESKCRKCTNQNCWLGSVQHVCPSQQYHFIKCTFALTSSPSLFYTSFPFPFLSSTPPSPSQKLTEPHQIYRDDDKPAYTRGNKVLLGILAWNVVFIIAIKGYYMWRNSSREKIWNSWTQEQKDEYLATTNDKGNKRYVVIYSHFLISWRRNGEASSALDIC